MDSNVAPHPASERMQLYNIEAEKALLGAIFMQNRVIEAVEDIRAEHFNYVQHAKIFEAASEMIAGGQLVDSITLQKFFERDDSLQEIGGTAYLDEITTSAVTLVNAKEYARIIRDLYGKRQLQGILFDAQQALMEDRPVRAQLERLEGDLFGLAETGQASSGLRQIEGFVSQALSDIDEAYKNKGPVAGIDTGFVGLDRLLNPLTPGRLYVVAGRPAMGKTALAWNIARNAARNGHHIALFSAEMAGEEIVQRELTGRTQISQGRMIRGEIYDTDMRRLVSVGQDIEKLPILIDDSGTVTVATIRARARRMKRRHGLKLIIVDYLQLLEDDRRRGNQNRTEEVSTITRGLKRLARDLAVPVMALSQLSRQVEARDNKRPQLSDLRESGSIEQDADAVIFLYREAYYLGKAEPKQREGETIDSFSGRLAHWQDRLDAVKHDCEVIVAKQRFGAEGTAFMYFDPERMAFGSKARQEGET